MVSGLVVCGIQPAGAAIGAEYTPLELVSALGKHNVGVQAADAVGLDAGTV